MTVRPTPKDDAAPAPGAAVVRALEGRTTPVQASTPPPAGPRPGERTLRLLTVAVVALAAALLTGRAWLLALAAGPLVLLALALPRRYPRRVATSLSVEPRRCFEGDTITVRVDVAHDGDEVRLDPGVTLGPGVRLDAVVTGPSSVTLRLTATEWGRWSIGPVDLDVYDAGGTVRRSVRVEAAEVAVFPYAGRSRFTPIPARLPQRLGEHTAAQYGEGVEVVGVRQWEPGERQRRIHWPSTLRRGEVQLHRFAAERAADTVMLIDAFGDVIDPATGVSSLDETVRAATGLARAYLRTHDRVGVVSVGGATRWLQPQAGNAAFYRIVESVLDVRKDRRFDGSGLQRVPVPALPEGALVYVFTPLSDGRVLKVLRDLQARARRPVVVEIPSGDPEVEPGDVAGELGLRLWHADRDAMRFALRDSGVPVLRHTAGEPLDLALAPLLTGRVGGRPR
ncbi:DUF58 domain-containing protein [Streptomyces sp. VRA16 Mangrove soil]|uniref:DUF58 domain-containing protein n=1 Tax=Streptomyces sp. VRA16 Mangrove soil TaxID=2817434 RepID=UPI001A9CCC3B|nr:DUF58 domain-containing protein [Streptomyces sp. VRA16 Mangrove soil]MBO1329646.1 DUF58 domain-containing protein [Streptomyces sp. VRA16 Mangrove soil]